jgi:hypothetical protein
LKPFFGILGTTMGAKSILTLDWQEIEEKKVGDYFLHL